MKKMIQILICCALTLWIGQELHAQKPGAMSFTKEEKSAFYKGAAEFNKQAQSRFEKIKIEKTLQGKALMQILTESKQLAKNAVEAGSNLSDQRYQPLADELKSLELKLDGLASGDKAGPPYTCMGGCNADFPKGKKGTGWDRFLCKLNCFFNPNSKLPKFPVTGKL